MSAEFCQMLFLHLLRLSYDFYLLIWYYWCIILIGLHILRNSFIPWVNPTWIWCSVQFSHSVISNSLRPHGLQHARPPCPSPTPRVYSNSCLLSQWYHPTISSSIVPFSCCLQSFPASGYFLIMGTEGKNSNFPQRNLKGIANGK